MPPRTARTSIAKGRSSTKKSKRAVKASKQASARIPAGADSSMKMMFVASHGLQSPLSAIRWGSSRLKKTDMSSFTDEQIHLVDGIARNAKTLSRMLDAMLILAKVEDGGYRSDPKKIYLRDFLATFIGKLELPRGYDVELSADEDMLVTIDRGLLEAIVQAVLLALSSPAADKARIEIGAGQGDGLTLIRFRGPVQLSLLSPVRASDDADAKSAQLVGGATGLMLSIARSLSAFLSGSVELSEAGEGEYVVTVSVRG